MLTPRAEFNSSPAEERLDPGRTRTAGRAVNEIITRKVCFFPLSSLILHNSSFSLPAPSLPRSRSNSPREGARASGKIVLCPPTFPVPCGLTLRLRSRGQRAKRAGPKIFLKPIVRPTHFCAAAHGTIPRTAQAFALSVNGRSVPPPNMFC